jgi:hypothetical protein
LTERKLKYSLGVFLISSHFSLLLCATVLYFVNGFSIDEFTTIVAIIAPIFAGYTTSVLAFFIKEAHVLEDQTSRVTTTYSALSFAIPIVLVSMFAVAMALKVFNKAFASFEDFKRFVMLVESLFGAYVGMFVYSLFEKHTPVGIPEQ